MRKRESYRALILENIEYDVLSQNVQLDKDRLDELVELMVDTVCSNREMIRVCLLYTSREDRQQGRSQL